MPLLASVRHALPWLRHVFADGGYAGAKLQTALAGLGSWTIETSSGPCDAKGFQLPPRRWVVERTLAWLSRNRHLAKAFEALIETATAWLLLASVKLLSRRLARLRSTYGIANRALRMPEDEEGKAIRAQRASRP